MTSKSLAMMTMPAMLNSVVSNSPFAPHHFLMNPSLIGKGYFEKREGPPFSKMAKIVLGVTTVRIPLTQPQRDHEGRKP